jgi:hypothetical protein
MRRAVALVILAVLTALVAVPQASAKLSIRVAKPVKSVTIPNSTAIGTYFQESQRVSTVCRSKELALAPGLIDVPRHIVGQSFGPSAVGAYATGEKGKLKRKFQLHCAKGSKISHKRIPGKVRGSSGTGSRATYTATAKAGCGKKRYAIGSPLSQEFAPGFGRFASKPAGPHAWEATVEGIPSVFPFDTTVPVYADVACVPKSSLKAVTTIDDSTSGLLGARTATLKLNCAGGRRAVGWGVDLRPFTRSTFSASSDGWALPIVRKAAFAGGSVSFQFDLPPGARTGAENGLTADEVAQTGYVVCAKPA